MTKGRAGTMTHDYKRNGTTTLFAAPDVLTGKVIGQCLPRHRHEEFLTFLRTIDREVPKGLGVHLILDNYATHKHPYVAPGSSSTRGSSCTSPRPRRAGSTKSNALTQEDAEPRPADARSAPAPNGASANVSTSGST
jgi:hypothetical protein